MTSFIGHNTPVHVTINTITFSMCAHDTRRFHDKNRLTIFLFDISIYVQIHNIYFFTHKILHMYTVMLFFHTNANFWFPNLRLTFVTTIVKC